MIAGLSGEVGYSGDATDVSDCPSGGTMIVGNSDDEPVVRGVVRGANESEGRVFSRDRRPTDHARDPTPVYELSSDEDEGTTHSLPSMVVEAYEEARMRGYYAESEVIPDEVATTAPMLPVYNVRGELLQADARPGLPAFVHMADRSG